MAKAKGDMFQGVITRNIIRGECPHECGYCYMKTGFRAKIEAYHKPYHINTKALNERYKPNEMYFIGSATDMWAESVPKQMIRKVLSKIREDDVSDSTQFLFQTKNPARYVEFLGEFPVDTVLGITLETDKDQGYERISKAPKPHQRIDAAAWLRECIDSTGLSQKIMVNMEPVINFSHLRIFEALKTIKPEHFTVGAETGGWMKRNNITEPTWQDIIELAYFVHDLVGKFYVKKNIWRLADKSERGEFIKCMRQRAVDYSNVIIQGQPESEGKVFFMEVENG